MRNATCLTTGCGLRRKDGACILKDLFGNDDVALTGCVAEGAFEPFRSCIAGGALLAMRFQGMLAIPVGKSAEMIEPFGYVVVSLHFDFLGCGSDPVLVEMLPE